MRCQLRLPPAREAPPLWLSRSSCDASLQSPRRAPPSPAPQAELLCRVATLLLRLHMSQLASTASARPALLDLRRLLRRRVRGHKDAIGFNLAAMEHVRGVLRERHAVPEGDGLGASEAEVAALAVRPLKRRAAERSLQA